METDGTHRQRRPGIPVRTLRAVVTEGPDAGLSFVAPEDVLTVGTAEGNGLRLTDRTVSRFHLELRRLNEGILTTDLGSTNGTRVAAATLDGARVVVDPGATIRIGSTTLRVEDGDEVVVRTFEIDSIGGLLGRSAVMQRLFASISQLGSTNAPVLIVGESGTGKELIARAIHEIASQDAPMATVDCAATVPALFASELFGHERGAFTGAEQRREGAFSLANHGTIFLDEIGELSPEIQSLLLGVLERRRFRRVGGSDDVTVDVRVISATHRDLRADVNAARFRLDLFFRLAVVTLRVPALRERREDIPLLVEHFLREAAFEGPVEAVFPEEAMRRLIAYHWPGNVRELRNVVEAAIVLGAPRDLGNLSSTESFGGAETFAAVRPLGYRAARKVVVDAFERDYLQALLERSGGSVRQAARVAQMDRSYLTELLQRHQIGERQKES
ncbi:MAG: sigma 54-dependent Fis family transcriptional regulator [Myxococcales bacterium]|nr:sigma 54-dependent Fis family transcriptional regulator [Myxococcales bacterium]